MRPLCFPGEQFSTITADDVTARPLAASVALGYDERSTQANIQHVENPRRAGTQRNNSDATGATGDPLVRRGCVENGNIVGCYQF